MCFNESPHVIASLKVPAEIQDESGQKSYYFYKLVPGQLSEFVVLLEVWSVGRVTLAVANGRTGWRPDLRVTARIPILHTRTLQ